MSEHASCGSAAGARLRWLWLAAGLLAALSILFAAWQLYRLINPTVSMEVATPACDLQAGVCGFELDDGSRVSLEMAPRPLQPLTPLQVRVTVEGVEPRSVALDLVGLDMYMGYNRPQLSRHDDGSYRGQLILPVCSNRVMNWRARLLIERDGELISAPFEFLTHATRG